MSTDQYEGADWYPREMPLAWWTTFWPAELVQPLGARRRGFMGTQWLVAVSSGAHYWLYNIAPANAAGRAVMQCGTGK